MIATEPIPEMLFEIPHYGRHGFDYWHQTADGRIVAGGFRDVSLQEEFTADEVTTSAVQAALEVFVSSLVGRLLRVDCRWAGIFGMVFDFLPVVGRVPGADGVWVAGGYSGLLRVRSSATAMRFAIPSSRADCSDPYSSLRTSSSSRITGFEANRASHPVGS